MTMTVCFLFLTFCVAASSLLSDLQEDHLEPACFLRNREQSKFLLYVRQLPNGHFQTIVETSVFILRFDFKRTKNIFLRHQRLEEN